MAASSLFFARASPVNRSLLLRHLRLACGTDVALPYRRYSCNAAMAAGSGKPEEKLSLPSSSVGAEGVTSAAAKLLEVMEPRKDHRLDDPDYRKWKDKEEEILRDIKPIVTLTKEILHSKRYLDGEHLTIEDERAVVEKLLAYHPHSEDKIGCGLDSIIMKLAIRVGNWASFYVAGFGYELVKKAVKVHFMNKWAYPETEQKCQWEDATNKATEVDRHPQFRQSRCLFVVRTDGLWIDFSYQKCLRSYIRLKYPSFAERFIQEHYKRGSG